jgi:sporulation protein YlmC with PRC-barrel domain
MNMKKFYALPVAAMAAAMVVTLDVQPALPQAAVDIMLVDVAKLATGYRVSKLTGKAVQNDKNEKIGSLDDFVIAQDKVLFAILQVGGFLGVGGKLIAVPFELLQISENGDRIVMPNATKDDLKKLPDFKYS